MPQVNLPATLGPAFWEKQKPTLAKLAKPPQTKLAEELKALAKQHIGVDWKSFEGKLDDLDAPRLRDLETALKTSLVALGECAKAVGAAAEKFEADARKDSKFPKEPIAATTTIAKSAREYRGELDAFITTTRKAIATRLAAALSAQTDEKSAAKPGVGSAAAKQVRSRALEALRKIKKPKPGDRPVRFMVVQGKTSVATYMGPSIGPTQETLLKSLIPDEAPYKVFKDLQGQVIWEKNAATFVSDRMPSGLGKKMQLWLKPILKVNLKLRVRKTTGESEETDGEEISDEALAAEGVTPEQAAEELRQRLATLGPALRTALAGPFSGDVKVLMATALSLEKEHRFDEADAKLDALEALLERADAIHAWEAECEVAVDALKQVAKAIAGARHASSAKAVAEIDGVVKRIKEVPTSAAQAVELQRFLAADGVIADVCEFATDIRSPMLHALEQLRAQLAA